MSDAPKKRSRKKAPADDPASDAAPVKSRRRKKEPASEKPAPEPKRKAPPELSVAQRMILKDLILEKIVKLTDDQLQTFYNTAVSIIDKANRKPPERTVNIMLQVTEDGHVEFPPEFKQYEASVRAEVARKLERAHVTLPSFKDI